ncbi:MAG: glycoside hydrolase family 3 C-terminal domain-containing protein [Treponema sp.]|jgi:beta-glucosidase|nr:glycoside hydrolase family 3 C-terminal domain-containing protein [Treponema sp.]
MKFKNLSLGKKTGLIAGITIVVLLGITALYGFVITRSGYWLLSRFRSDTPAQKLAYSSASDTVRTIAEEGIVLLKNEGALLPIETRAEAKTKINLFGIRSIQLVYNGGGSTASDVTKCVKLEPALEGANYELNKDLLYLYYNFYATGKIAVDPAAVPPNGSASEFIDKPDNIVIPEVPASVYANTSLYRDGKTIIDHALSFSDTALVVLGRGGGEGFDLTGPELRINAEETALLDAVCAAFSKVALVINSANTLELDFLARYPAIKAILWIGYPGESGTESLAKILNGTVNPSGRLADTWAANNFSAPAANNFKERRADDTWAPTSFHYVNAPAPTNTTVLYPSTIQGFFNHYAEGVYVGYKYYETRAATDPSYNYREVVFPFGYGLSYTTFKEEIMAMQVNDGVVTLRVSVENTGKRPGKDVLEVYYRPPYTGNIEKAAVNLAAFKKTNLIAPGGIEYYTISFNVEDMASYDYRNNQCWVLEKGDYEILLMKDAHTKIGSETWTLGQDIVYKDGQNGKRSSDRTAAVNRLDDALGIDDYLTRSWDSGGRAFTGPRTADFTAGTSALDALVDWKAPTDAELGLSGEAPAHSQTLAAPLRLADMVTVPYGDPRWDTFVSQLTLKEMSDLAGNGAWQINGIERLGIPRSLTPDGSTGIFATTYSGAVMGASGAGVTYPTPVVIASTWNEDVARLMGISVGSEGQAYGYNGWYAPSMNIHRTPFNARNFEYYSEDGVLAGKIAASVVAGAREKGMITFIKHFAMNEREENCRDKLFTWATEQAIREIYLKPFELAIKEGGALGIMTAFNYIGHTWVGGHEGILTGIVRDEWGFPGVIITDAAIHGHMIPLQWLAAGGDLSLDVGGAWTGGSGGHGSQLLKAAEDPASRIWATRALLRTSKDILYAVSRSWKLRP